MVQRPEILSIPVASTGPIFIVPELLAWTPAAHFAGTVPEIFVQSQNTY